MPTLTDGVETKACAITARVTQTFYDDFAVKAAEVSGRSPTEYARELLERALYGDAAELKLMAELLALRRIVVRGLLSPDVEMTRPAVLELLAAADSDKHERAKQAMRAAPTTGTATR